MSNDKGFFDTAEFRALLEKYEQMKEKGICSYFETHELSDIHSYYLYKEDSHEAANVFKLAKQLHHGSPDITKMEIRAMLTFGHPEAALPMFNNIEYDNDDDTQMLKAEVLLALKQYKASRKIAHTILSRYAITDDISYDAMEIMLDCGYAQEVLECANEGLKHHPRNKNLLEVKAESLIELQRTDEAISIYNSLLDENPYTIFYWEQLGHIYYMIERYGKAIDCFEYELTIDANIEYAQMMQGYCLYHLKCYDKAIEIFNRFIAKYPQSIMPRFYKALSQAHRDNTEQAIQEFSDTFAIAYKQDYNSIECMLCKINEAILLVKSNRQDEARKCMTYAILFHPSSDNMKQLLLGGNPYYELRDKENMTFRDINATENREWKGYEILTTFGTGLMTAGLNEFALLAFNFAKSTAPDSSDIDANIAYILHCEKEDKEKLEKYVENALEGKSNRLFELFGIPYDGNIGAREFLKKIN